MQAKGSPYRGAGGYCSWWDGNKGRFILGPISCSAHPELSPSGGLGLDVKEGRGDRHFKYAR